MPHTWRGALANYRYPVDLAKFAGGRRCPGWFELNTEPGDRERTMGFEHRFRDKAQQHPEAWGEVVFWKLYKMPLARNKTTQRVLDRIRHVDADELWRLCVSYVENPCQGSFSAFREKLFDTPRVATAATFPAFLCPQRFPMVDIQVTRWAGKNGPSHCYSGVGGPDLVCVPDLRGKQVMEGQWPFVESWIKWCQFTAGELSRRTGCVWRARDVEMAVFTAQRDDLPLTPLAQDAR